MGLNVKKLPIAQRLALSLGGHMQPQLEPLIDAYQAVKEIVEMDVAKSVGAAIDEIRYRRLTNQVEAFIKVLDEANGRV